MARDSKRWNARLAGAGLRFVVSWIAMGSLCSLLVSRAVRGQDLIPAPPDFKIPKSESKPALGSTPFAAEAAAELPDHTGVPGRLERARVMMNESRHQEALDEVEHVIGQDSKNPQALLLRVLCRGMLGLALDDSFLDAELDAVEHLLEKTPSDGRARAIRGILLTSKGDLDRAIADLSYAIEHHAARVQVYYYRGLARMRRHDYKSALDDFNLAAGRCDPHRIPSQILTGRGRCYAACGDLDRAISDFTAVIERNPMEYQPYQLRAEAYLEKKDLGHALADHDQIVKLRPVDLMVYLARSFLREEKGDNVGALADMDRAVQLDPQASVPYFCRAVLTFLLKQDGDRALADMDRAIALAPRFPLFYAFRGYLRAQKPMYVPALKDFALCLSTISQMEIELYCDIDRVRGRFSVGLNWWIKDDPKAPKPKMEASNVDRQVIDVATRRLVAAAFAPAK